MTLSSPTPQFDQEVLIRLALTRASGPVNAALCLVSASTAALLRQQGQFLHDQEALRMTQLPVAKRAGDFLRGRYACKRAVGVLFPGLDARHIAIGAGVFQQPLLQTPHGLGLQVSITHSGTIGAAIATPEGHPMAIDVEQFSEANSGAIRSQLSEAELALAGAGPLAPLQAATILWSMKEALSKVLRCGLTASFEVLEVARIERNGACLTGTFRHFSQYKAVALDLGGHALCIVLPRHTDGLALDALGLAFDARDY